MRALQSALLLTSSLVAPTLAGAATVGNPLCPGEEVSFNPGNGEDIVVPDGFAVSVFAKGLNFPTGIAFRGNSQRFEVYVLESGSFPASRCNDGAAWQANGLPGNPFTPDVVVFDPKTFKDQSTFDKPNVPSVGVRYLLVNGTPVVDAGKLEDGVNPGKAITSKTNQ